MEFYSSVILKNRVLNKLLRLSHGSQPDRLFHQFGTPGGSALAKLGSDYGGWFAPVSLGANWVVYSLGIGQDTTFDSALMDQYGVTVHGFDPTPAAVEHVEQRKATSSLYAEKFLFSPVGVWDADCEMRFYEPKTRGWVGSYSALNLQGTSRYIDVPCKKLSTLMRQRQHDRIDLLKMDIEGAEYRVLRTILEERIQIGWLCVEFDQPVPVATTKAMIQQLIGAGFILRHVDKWNFTFENHAYAC